MLDDFNIVGEVKGYEFVNFLICNRLKCEEHDKSEFRSDVELFFNFAFVGRSENE